MPIRTYSKQRSFLTDSDAPPPRKKRRLDSTVDTDKDRPIIDNDGSSSPAPQALLDLRSSSPPIENTAMESRDSRNMTPSRSSPPASPPSSASSTPRKRSPLQQTSPNISRPNPTTHKPLPRLTFLKKHHSSSLTAKALQLSRSNQKPQKSFTQLTIDLGGPAHKRCPLCGMDYLPANPEDSALHKKFHARSLGGLDVSRGLLGRGVEGGVVRRVDVSTCTRKRNEGAGKEFGAGSKGGDGARYLMDVDAMSGVRYKKLAERVLEVVEGELGAVPIGKEQLWGMIGGEHLTSVEHDKKALDTRTEPDHLGKMTKQYPRYKVTLYILSQKCVGLCLSERITQGFAVLPSTSISTASTSQQTSIPRNSAIQAPPRPSPQLTSSSSSITTATTPSPASIGISRIWVSKTARGQGIASRLLDEARSVARGSSLPPSYGVHHSQPAVTVSREMLAFSQPTESGGKLARRWFGRESGWLVYVD